MSDDGPRPGSSPSSAGPEHDAWLRQALRHAPDASASPPPSLRDAILAEARAAARSGATRRAAAAPASSASIDRLLAFWSWLARPPVAAGFASVMAATLVGMLWWDRPMDETMLPPPSSPAVTAPKPVQERSDAAGQAPSPRTDSDSAAAPSVGRPPEAARPTAPAAGLREAAPVPEKSAAPRAAEAAAMEEERKQQVARASADERARSQAKLAAKTEVDAAARKSDRLEPAPQTASPTATAPAARATPPPAPGLARPAAEAPSPFPARSSAEGDAAPRPAAPAAVPPSPAPAPPAAAAAPPATAPTTPSPQPSATATGRTEPFALAKKAESGEKEGAADKARSATPPAELRGSAAGSLGAATDSSEASSTARAAAQNATRPATRQAAPAVASPRPMALLLAALTSEETRWSRRLPNGGNAAVDAALRTWLAQVQSAASARWQSAGEPGARRDAPGAASATILRLERDGRDGATVQIEDGGVLFLDPLSGGAWFAPLPPDVIARLRSTAPR